MAGYSVEPNLADWLPVPSVFPNEYWNTAEDWAKSIAEAAFEDDVEAREIYHKLAREVAENQNPEADHTFWFSPEDGRSMGTATLNVYVDEPDLSLDEISMPPYESLTRRQVESFFSETFGEVLQSATTFSTEEVVVGQPADSIVGHIRTVGRYAGAVFVINALDSDTSTLALMMEPMIELLESISIDS